MLEAHRRSNDFYPRPPRGGRRHTAFTSQDICDISIHALREEGDHKTGEVDYYDKEFLSTPSARRATPGVMFSAG